MFRTFAAAFLLTGLVACNKVPTVQAQSSDSNPSYDNLAPAADDASQAPYAGDDQAAPPESEAIQTSEAPPALPEYEQPMAPGPDYYWTPGYWAWGPGGYYWVPGDWVQAPWVGAVWTPPYWGFDNGYYLFHSGYWGPHVGFYGGIDYGFGYPGRGYYGAYWNGGHLFYNSAVTRVNQNVIHNVYRHDVPRFQSSRVSFNGGHGGINIRPTRQEQVVTHERRAPAQAVQMRVAQQARQEHNRTNFAAQPNRSDFNGRPAPQAPQAPQARPEQRSAPQRNDAFRPVPHPAPVAPQQMQQRPAAPVQRESPVQRQAPQRRPDLQNHLELQQQRPAPAPAPPAPAPHAAPVNPRQMQQRERPAAPVQRQAPAPAAPRATPQPPQPRPAAPPQAAAPQRGNGGERGNGGGRGDGGERGRGDH